MGTEVSRFRFAPKSAAERGLHISAGTFFAAKATNSSAVAKEKSDHPKRQARGVPRVCPTHRVSEWAKKKVSFQIKEGERYGQTDRQIDR